MIMKKTMYIAPSMEMTEIELHPLMDPSVTGAGGDAGVGLADPSDPAPGTAQSRRKDIWTDPEEEEENENAYRF